MTATPAPAAVFGLSEVLGKGNKMLNSVPPGLGVACWTGSGGTPAGGLPWVRLPGSGFHRSPLLGSRTGGPAPALSSGTAPSQKGASGGCPPKQPGSGQANPSKAELCRPLEGTELASGPLSGREGDLGSSSGSRSGSDSPALDNSRRLPVFSRPSTSDD